MKQSNSLPGADAAEREKIKREKDIAVIHRTIDELNAIMNRESLPTSGSPSIIVLSLFYRRFKDSVQAVRKLEGMRDSMLIARSMIEGIALLIWILEDVSVRAKEYLDLYLIELQQRIQVQENAGRVIPQGHKDAIKKALSDVSDRILTGGEFNDFIIFDEPLKSEDFYRRLTGKSYAELFAVAQGKRIHITNYSYMSGYHHGNPYQILAGMKFPNWNLNDYGSDARQEYAMAVVASYVCFVHSAQDLLRELKKEDTLLKINPLQENLFREGVFVHPNQNMS